LPRPPSLSCVSYTTLLRSAPVSTLVKWFPDKRGLATGMAVMGFGAGSIITSPVATALMDSVGLSNTFFILGISFLVLMLSGALRSEEHTSELQSRENLVCR